MKYLTRPQLSYVSPWILAAATALLVLIVVTFTLNNIQREKYLMTEALLEKADTLIRIVHSGARASYFADLKRGLWNAEPWNEYAQRVVDHVSEDPAIKFLAIVNEAGKVVVHSNHGQIGSDSDFPLPVIPEEHKEKGPSILSHRIVAKSPEGRVFAAIRLFYPYFSLSGSLPPEMRNKNLRPQSSGPAVMPGSLPAGPQSVRETEPARQDPLFSPERGAPPSLGDGTALHKNYYILVGLDMSGFDHSLTRQKLQAFFLSLAMLLVGLGGWFSLAAVQGLRVSQKTLNDMRAFTGLLVAKLPVGIIATDKSGRITTWNAAATEMTGIQAEKACGKRPENILPPEFAVFFTPQISSSGSGNGQAREKEITIPLNGRKESLLCHINTVHEENSDEYKGQVLLISNLTELKDLEKVMRENERLAAVGRMAAGVAHEVRNPLSSIKGLAFLLKGKFDKDSRDSETAGLLIQEVERINRTVSELLSFARPASLELQKVSLKELLDKNFQLISSDTQSSAITISLETEENLKCVLGDKDRLNQVFLNLLLNAVQSMDTGGKLTVRAINDERDNSVKVTIEDTGCGIAQEHMTQLFYPYFTTKPGGTGIGLAISQKIVSDHKGTIKIDSIPGNGTVVTVELPVYEEGPAAIA
ncbi:MAG: ATP-binding protein [Desulfobulbaceae bacterium]|nr:ATP-binding protein [Desulfobulbaceae bacterium]